MLRVQAYGGTELKVVILFWLLIFSYFQQKIFTDGQKYVNWKVKLKILMTNLVGEWKIVFEKTCIHAIIHKGDQLSCVQDLFIYRCTGQTKSMTYIMTWRNYVIVTLSYYPLSFPYFHVFNRSFKFSWWFK